MGSSIAVAWAGAIVAAALYRLHLYRWTRRMYSRFEEQLAERTRTAEELHDTLLQGIMSASMQVHVANDGLPDDARVKPVLNHALGQMEQVIQEGRKAVQGLRASRSASLDLEQAFAAMREEFGSIGRDVDLQVVTHPNQRELNPLLRDQVYRIGREALLNAVRNAGARHIEIELRYTRRHLQMFVRDDGLPLVALRSEVVQERAKTMGAELRVFRRPSGGTELELSVPARHAYLR